MKRLDDFEDYRTAVEKREEIKGQLYGKRAEANAIRTDLAAPRPTGRDLIDLEAQALLTGQATASPPESERLVELDRECRVLERALQIQESEVSRLQTLHSDEVCASVQKQYTDALRKAIDHATAFSQAFATVRQTLEDLQEGGVYVHSLPRLNTLFGSFGDWRDAQAGIYRLLAEAEAEGIIKPGDHKGRAAPAGEYDAIPAQGVERLASGPDGLRRVRVHRGGKVETLEWLHRPDDNAAADGWQH